VHSERALDIKNPPQRAYTQEEMEKVTQNAPRVDYFGNRTIIKIEKDVKNKRLFSRLSRINNNVISAYERALWYTRRDFFNIFGYFKIPNIIRDESWRLYSQIVRKGYLKGYSRKLTFAAIIYVFCRTYNYPIFGHEIAEYYSIKKRRFKHAIYKLFKNFNIKMPPMNLRVYITRMCSLLNIKYDAKRVETMLQVSKTCRAYDPRGIIGAIVYLLNHGKTSQVRIAEPLGLGDDTLQNRKNEILTNFKIGKTRS
jgi:transcription initiation factor TFIIB